MGVLIPNQIPRPFCDVVRWQAVTVTILREHPNLRNMLEQFGRCLARFLLDQRLEIAQAFGDEAANF